MTESTKLSPAELREALGHFYGGDTLTRWSALSRSVLSDGALFLAQEAGAFWLFDAIDSHLTTRGLNQDTEFTVATLTRKGDGAELVLDDGNGVIWATQAIELTDFPLDTIKLYACWNGRGWTHMIPSEY